jgi:hypothetical protein
VKLNRIIGVGVMLLLLTAVGCQAVPREVCQKLPPAQARQLEVYSTNHAVAFDPRLHSIDTCPFFAYLPNEMFLDHNSKEYAEWAYRYYSKKHEEEEWLWQCKCAEQLKAAPKSATSAGGR